MAGTGDLVERLYAAMNEGDVSALGRLISNGEDVVVIGTDPNEFWVGPQARQAFEAQLPEMHAAGVAVRSTGLAVSEQGDVGWFSDSLEVTSPAGVVPFRLTGVARREVEGWLFVQTHASIGVGNQEAVGMDLPT